MQYDSKVAFILLELWPAVEFVPGNCSLMTRCVAMVQEPGEDDAK